MILPLHFANIFLYLYEIKPKVIKKSTKILIIALALLVFLLASPFILLRINKVQNSLVDFITTELSKKLGAKVEIDRVDYRFFNDLELRGVLLEDLNQDTLLFVDGLTTSFVLKDLFKDKIRITDLLFDEAYIHLKTDVKGISNADFVLKKFKTGKDSSKLDMQIKKLTFKNSRFYFTKFNSKKGIKTFNAERMRFSDINIRMAVNQYKKDTIDLEIKKLNLKEASGLVIKDFFLTLKGSDKTFSIDRFGLEMPGSDIKIPEMKITNLNLKDSGNVLQKAKFSIPVKNAVIALKDLKAFLPGFATSKEKINVSANIAGMVSNLKIQDLIIKTGRQTEINTSIDINGLPNIAESFIYADIQKISTTKADLQDLLSGLTRRPVVLPELLDRTGALTYNGNLTGFITDLVAYGNLSSDVGSISSDFSVKFTNNLKDIAYSGDLKSTNLSLNNILNDTTFGNLAFNLKTVGQRKYKQDLKGTIDAVISSVEFNKYNYKNTSFTGSYNGTGFNGNIVVKDENIDVDLNGLIDFRDPKIPVFDFDLILKNTNLYALKLIKNYPASRLSFKSKTNISGSNFDNLNGLIQFDNIVFTNDNKTLNGNSLTFTSRTDPGNTYFGIRSDFINGAFSGDFKYSSIGRTFRNVLSKYLPAIARDDGIITNNRVNVNLTINNTDEITKVLNLPYEFDGETTITGTIDEAKKKIDLNSKIATVKTDKQIFDNLTLRLENRQDQLVMTGRAQMQDKNEDVLNMFLSANAVKDALSAKFIWQNNKDVTNAGEVDTKTLFFKQDKNLRIHTKLNPTEIIISDSVWNLRSSDIYFNSDSLIRINNFMFESKKQYISINGDIAKNQQDSLVVKMNELNLDYVMRLLRLKGINMGGIITGKMRLFSLLKEPIYLANLKVNDFSLNDKVIADADIKTTWDKEKNQLNLSGNFINKKNELVATGTGSLVPKTDSLNILIDAKKIPADFLNRYFEGVASNFSGYGNGNFRIFGPTKQLRFDGDIMVNDGKVTIDMLQTTYRFNDRVRLTPKRIDLNYVRLYDEDKNQAVLTGSINHDGTFSNMKYDMRISSDNIMGLNTANNSEEFFYGKAYLGGLVRIFGDDDVANIIVNGTSRPKTKCYMSMGTASTVVEGDFIKFVEKRLNTYVDTYQEEKRKFANADDFNVRVDMQIEVTPEAEMEILVDPSAGDKITGRGRGNIRVKFDTFSDVELYGTVELDQGYYLFTLQTVIRKEFKVNQGSTISWTGDPFGAKVNINGYYPLSASLTDIIEQEELQQITNRSTVPVHCLLYLTEDLMTPKIKFGIDFPSSDESLKSRVRSIINTEEMMNRQILFLLLFHRFFDNTRSTASAVGVNEGLSFATATASAQINSWIQNTLNSNIFSLGFDWQKTDALSDEIKAQILIQPNNRLVINGEVGYRNDNISENKLIGDFDLEYKLIESGKLRFTVYNHTIDRAQLREAKFTQGVGLIYREDFNNIGEMFEYYWKLITDMIDKKLKESKVKFKKRTTTAKS